MGNARMWSSLFVGMMLVAAACGSGDAMTGDDLAECIALSKGSLGGSSNLISAPVLLLPDVGAYPEGASDAEVEAEFDRRFSEAYGIEVDDFMDLRAEADAATTASMGEPPGVGELVGDEWFVERDIKLMMLWNDRHPASAKAFCALIADERQAS